MIEIAPIPVPVVPVAVPGPVLVYEGLADLCPMLERSPGAHVSAIISDLSIRLGHYERSLNRHLPMTKLQLGCALEHAIAARYQLDNPSRYVSWSPLQPIATRPLEIKRDGIAGTPDIWDVYDGAIEEVKLTWKSARHEIESDKLIAYWWQLKMYCWMMGIVVGRLHIGYVNGDYKFGVDGDAMYHIWEWRFSQSQLDQNADMLRRHRDRMEIEMVRDGRTWVAAQATDKIDLQCRMAIGE